MEDFNSSYDFSNEFLEMVQKNLQPQEEEGYVEPVEEGDGEVDEENDYDSLKQQYEDLLSENEQLKTEMSDYRFSENENIQNDDMFNSLYENTPSKLINMVMEDEMNGAPSGASDLSWVKRKSDMVNIQNIDGRLANYVKTLPKNLQEKLLVTSGNDQSHAKGSKHYSNKAIDLRFFPEVHDYIKNDPLAPKFGVKVLNPNHGAAKHTHLEVKQYGGKVKMENGGKNKKRQPIITNDPNDPRLKNYKDSLGLYNKTKLELKDVGNSSRNTMVYVKSGVKANDLTSPDYDFINHQLLDVTGKYDSNMNPNNNFPRPKVKQRIMPIAGIGVNEDNSMGGWHNIYKKPVQPVVYKKPIPQEKPFVKQFNPNMVANPEDVNPSMLGNPTPHQTMQLPQVQPLTEFSATWRDETQPSKQASKYFNNIEEWQKFVYDNPEYNFQSTAQGKNRAQASGYKIFKKGGKYKVK